MVLPTGPRLPCSRAVLAALRRLQRRRTEARGCGARDEGEGQALPGSRSLRGPQVPGTSGPCDLGPHLPSLQAAGGLWSSGRGCLECGVGVGRRGGGCVTPAARELRPGAGGEDRCSWSGGGAGWPGWKLGSPRPSSPCPPPAQGLGVHPGACPLRCPHPYPPSRDTGTWFPTGSPLAVPGRWQLDTPPHVHVPACPESQVGSRVWSATAVPTPPVHLLCPQCQCGPPLPLRGVYGVTGPRRQDNRALRPLQPPIPGPRG